MIIGLCKDNEKFYRVSGRTTYIGDILYLGFSGSFIEFECNSHTIEMNIVTDSCLQDENLLGRIAVYVDDETTPVIDRMLTQYSTTLTFSVEDTDKLHRIRIEKISEAAFGLVGIKQLVIEDTSSICATKKKNHLIEIIGDSITCGYGVEAENELEAFCTQTENCEKSYSIQTARALNADYSLVSWSGIGIISNWVPEDVNEPLEEILMPDLYKYRDLRLCERLSLEPMLWDNSLAVPDLIIINIGTNDDSYTRCIPDRVKYQGERYGMFLEQVYEANPTSSILCILGTMGQNLCEEESRQVDLFKKRHPDTHIGFEIMPEQDKENDKMGADYHPSAVSQRKAAVLLTQYVKKFMRWND